MLSFPAVLFSVRTTIEAGRDLRANVQHNGRTNGLCFLFTFRPFLSLVMLLGTKDLLHAACRGLTYAHTHRGRWKGGAERGKKGTVKDVIAAGHAKRRFKYTTEHTRIRIYICSTYIEVCIKRRRQKGGGIQSGQLSSSWRGTLQRKKRKEKEWKKKPLLFFFFPF